MTVKALNILMVMGMGIFVLTIIGLLFHEAFNPASQARRRQRLEKEFREGAQAVEFVGHPQANLCMIRSNTGSGPVFSAVPCSVEVCRLLIPGTTPPACSRP